MEKNDVFRFKFLSLRQNINKLNLSIYSELKHFLLVQAAAVLNEHVEKLKLARFWLTIGFLQFFRVGCSTVENWEAIYLFGHFKVGCFLDHLPNVNNFVYINGKPFSSQTIEYETFVTFF